MIIRVGEVTRPHPSDPDAPPVAFKVVQALDPVFELPVAQISIPKGEQSKIIGLAIADQQDSGLVIPDFIPPEDLGPGEG